MNDTPLVTFVIPLYNAADMLPRSVRSALRQRGVDVRVVIVDHGSTDGGDQVAAALAEDPRVELIILERSADDRRTPARPLNVGMAHAARTSGPSDRSWVFRLDADDFLTDDDVAAEQLARGGYRKLITATALFFNEEERYAYVYGPAPGDRTLERYRRRGAYSAAHPSNAVRSDLLRDVLSSRGLLMDQELHFGEDLDQTCSLLSSVGPDEFAVVDRPYCFKAIGSHTSTSAASARQLWTSHVRLHRRNPSLSRYALLRGFVELVLGDLVGEQRARRVLQRVAGRNGDFRECEYALTTRRLAELA